jgi:hypothetical protein
MRGQSVVVRSALVVLAVSAIVTAFAPPAGSVIPPAPTVTSVSPNAGWTTGGITVVIVGTGFTGATSVDFGAGNLAASFTATSTHITVTDPPGGPGTVDVTVTGPGGTSTISPADHFTYTTPTAPSLSSVSPSTGWTVGGTDVTITGSGFVGVTDVDFGPANSAEAWTVDSPTQISALAAASPAETVDITVTTGEGTSATSGADHFTYTVAPVPTVTSVTTSAGPATGATTGGYTVTIDGTGFTDASEVDFGTGNPSGFWSVNLAGNSISATAPASAPGTVDVLVTTPGGTSATSSADQFTFEIPSDIPVVTGVSPAEGTTGGGTLVTISGSGFSSPATVSFGTKAGTSPSISSTSITVTSPAETSGTVDVTVTTVHGTSLTSLADEFTFAGSPVLPTVTGVVPSTGSTAGSTPVTITGTNFLGVTAVDFGAGRAATGVHIQSNTQITATTPPGVAGTVDVTVTTPGGTSPTISADHFMYVAPVVPSVVRVSPSSGPTSGGTTVAITGTNFTGASAVIFGAATASFTVNSSSQITAHSPAGTGTVNVRVTGPGGTSGTNSSDEFSYTSSGGGGGGGPTPHGYWLVAGDGGIFTFGSAHFYGSTGSIRLQRPVVGMTPTADRAGYWMVATDGGMFAFGDARFFGSIPGVGLAPADSLAPKRLAAPIVAMVASPTGQGYLLVASDGGVFAFGNALFHGSCPGIGGCNGSVIAVVPDAGEQGYWVVTSTGHVYAFGNAKNVASGEPGATPAPITGATASADGRGYLIVDAKGDVYNYGDAQKYGKTPLGISVPSTEIVGIVPTSDGLGYWLMGRAGSVYNYGDAPGDGSMAGKPLNAPIVTAAGF